MTLTCRGGNPFHAHKIILAAASTYFKSFFKEVQGKMLVENTKRLAYFLSTYQDNLLYPQLVCFYRNQHPVIFVKDVESSEMEHLLQFIYRGEVDIPSEELERLIDIAKELGIVGLDAVNTDDNGGKNIERRYRIVMPSKMFSR